MRPARAPVPSPSTSAKVGTRYSPFAPSVAARSAAESRGDATSVSATRIVLSGVRRQLTRRSEAPAGTLRVRLGADETRLVLELLDLVRHIGRAQRDRELRDEDPPRGPGPRGQHAARDVHEDPTDPAAALGP
ncbi:hypothetical protein Anae109_3334 [Anaeromyxobacter sp. Fw109-5]|nr:hypothetical protein Anae109_3334 [Anaeromyxobacter sp. Fw109-5]